MKERRRKLDKRRKGRHMCSSWSACI